tara:strand:+ start:29 stop:355 length:327 start_codon:yes stop_codon:yes gene_type:complete
MIKNKLTLILIIAFSISLYACESVKNAVEGKKRSEQSDEFLVQKKNPLAMPPDYEELPTPGNQKVSPETFSDNNEVKDLLNIKESDISGSNNNDNSTDLESSIIKKIK